MCNQARSDISAIESPSSPPMKRRRVAWCDALERRVLANGIEEDERRIAQRQKQVDYGKNTIAYDRFVEICPRERRMRGDPMTPIVRQKCSKRSFLGQVTSWKKMVYAYIAELDAMEEEEREERRKRVAERVEERVEELILPECIAGKKEDEVDNKEEEEECEGDEDWFSEMDDIELDDEGNVIEVAGSGCVEQIEKWEAEAAGIEDETQAGAPSSSIFEDFE